MTERAPADNSFFMANLYMLILFIVLAGIGLSIVLNVPGSLIFVIAVVGYLSSRLSNWYLAKIRKIEAQ